MLTDKAAPLCLGHLPRHPLLQSPFLSQTPGTREAQRLVPARLPVVGWFCAVVRGFPEKWSPFSPLHG